MISTVEAALEAAVANGDIAGAVLMARDSSGTLNVARAYGTKTLKPGAGRPPMTTDTLVRGASFTKLLTAVIALQLVDEGVLDLDAPVDDVLPELAALKVLVSFEGGEAVYRDRKEPITLLKLLTHQSGCVYPIMDPTMYAWAAANGLNLTDQHQDMEENYVCPLSFEPGSAWEYGSGVDWAGRLIQRTTQTSLETHLQTRICAPLGITDLTFVINARPDLHARHGDVAGRATDTGALHYVDVGYFTSDPRESLAGEGVYLSGEAYISVLHSLLRNDARLLRPASRDLLFRDALSPEARASMNEKAVRLAAYKMGAALPQDVKRSFALGGMITLEDAPAQPWRRQGALAWSGFPNQFWVLDREADVCLLALFNIEPYGDDTCLKLCEAFEKGVYAARA